MPKAVEDLSAGTCPGGGPAAHLLGAHEVVLGPDDGEAGALCRGGQIPAQLSHGGLGSGAVEGEDSPAHIRTLGGSQLRCDGSADPSFGHPLDALIERSPYQLRDRLLARPGRLPYPGEVMPGIVRVEHPEGIAGPGPQQVGPRHGDGDDRAATHVVADDVDRLAECLQLRCEPVLVGLHGAIEAVWDGRTETGR